MASAGASIVRNVARRGVHISIVPRPMNISESREILQLLNQFGEVEYFRSLRYDARPSPNAAFAIFKDESAAQHCILKSPLRFRMSKVLDQEEQLDEQVKSEDILNASSTSWSEDAYRSSDETFDAALGQPTQLSASLDKEQRKDESLSGVSSQSCEEQSTISPSSGAAVRRQLSKTIGGFGVQQTRSLNTSSLPKPPREPSSYAFRLPGMPEPQPRPEAPQEEDFTIYQMHINPAKVNFMDRVEMGHYHGGFTNDWRSAINDDLKTRVPLKGMANLNWRMKTKSASTIRAEREAMLAEGKIGGLGEIYRAAQKKLANGGQG